MSDPTPAELQRQLDAIALRIAAEEARTRPISRFFPSLRARLAAALASLPAVNFSTAVKASWVTWQTVGLAAALGFITLTLPTFQGCTPGPSPTPTPTPVPPSPTPAPIAGDGLSAMIIFESADLAKLPKDQQDVMFGKSFLDFLRTNCMKGADGKTPEFRIVDKDTPGLPKKWADALARPRVTLPWLLVSNGKTGYEGPFTNEAEATKIVNRIKGK